MYAFHVQRKYLIVHYIYIIILFIECLFFLQILIKRTGELANVQQLSMKIPKPNKLNIDVIV